MMFFRQFVASAAIAFCVFQQAAAQYSISLPYKDVSVSEKNGKAVFVGSSFMSEPGLPELPAYTVSILLPPEADPDNVNVRLANPVYENLSGRFVVDPPLFFNKPHYPDSTKIVDGKDTTVYRKDAYYPANSKGLVHVDFYRHYQIVNVTVHPFLYNPVRQSLKRLVGGSIEVSFENKTSVLSGTAKAPIARVEAELRKTVANPEVLERYGTASVPSAPSLSPPPAAAVAYAIITTQAIYSSCKSEIDAYATHLVNHDGYDPSNVRIVTEGASEGYNTWADATEAQERALNIRQWLINYASEDWNVLLIGDPSPKTGDVPICL